MKSQIRLEPDNEKNLLVLQREIKSLGRLSLSRLANVAMWHGMDEAFRQFNIKTKKAKS